MKLNKLIAYDICHNFKMGNLRKLEMIKTIESMLDAGHSRFECQLLLQREINKKKKKHKRVKIFGFGKQIKQEKTSSVGSLQTCSSDYMVKKLVKNGRDYTSDKNIKKYRIKMSKRTEEEQKRIDWENRPRFVSIPMGGMTTYKIR